MVEATVAEFDRTVGAGNPTTTRLERLRARAVGELKAWRRSHGHTPASASKAGPALRGAKRATAQASVNLDEALAYIEELEEENKVLQEERDEAHRLVIALSNELEDLGVDTTRPERGRAILDLDLDEVARRRDAILAETPEGSEADVTMGEASDEEEEDMEEEESPAAQASNRRARASATPAGRARPVQVYSRERSTILSEIPSYLPNRSESSWDGLSDSEDELAC